MTSTTKAFAQQSERLAGSPKAAQTEEFKSTAAIEAKFLTPHDAVLETVSGDRLPGVPLAEARKLNRLGEEAAKLGLGNREQISGYEKDGRGSDGWGFEGHVDGEEGGNTSRALDTAAPPSTTNPMFPPLPLYGPPSILRNLQCLGFRTCSFFLSLAFLGFIVIASLVSHVPVLAERIGLRLRLQSPDSRRPFFEEEKRRRDSRRVTEQSWRNQRRRRSRSGNEANDKEAGGTQTFEPTEGGRDPLICDVGYYARRVGLDMEEYRVQTEDGFIIRLWHIYNPLEHTPGSKRSRDYKGPDIFPLNGASSGESSQERGKRRYPILMMHGLLQSSGAYCANDDHSLAFFLCKSGFDVWLGNNRCGFEPEHTTLKYSDPRMWAWNIRQMGVIDLPALVSRVLTETGFSKLALICHSQGTTETFLALAKSQRPDLGSKISVFCALAPAVYAGPLIHDRIHFRFMSLLSAQVFRLFFGIHAFIPIMMIAHRFLPGRLYGFMGYRCLAYMFNWSDMRWERDLRDRMFQFAPVFVSAESMRWWLGKDCFAKHKCILSTREEGEREEKEELENESDGTNHDIADEKTKERSAALAWYDSRVPPFAMWVGGADELVDGRRLIRRLESKRREPHVKLIHAKVIEEYEHLDVIWALDVIEKVGKEMRSIIWKTVDPADRSYCITPEDCHQ